MDPREIIALLEKAPFEPFAIRLLDGRVFDVRNPQLVVVGRRSVFIFSSPTNKLPIEDWVVISPVAIATMNPLAAA